MNTITSIFSLVCIMVMILAVVVAAKIANAQEVDMPVKAGITYICDGEPVPLGQCSGLTNAECCASLIEPASGDEVFAEWTPEEETRESYVPNDVIVE